MPHHHHHQTRRAAPATLTAAAVAAVTVALAVAASAVPAAAQVQAPGLQGPTRLVAPGAERGVIIISGRVVKVEGDAVTLRDATGRESTLSSPMAADLQPGDAVVVENGVLRKGR
ncbi:hypothetical protein [Caenispirillum bisanense]|uniref:hypothetical protein n=1 Tax=Caenispirillum bisanense TaxID=414052 RepID=UPI0031E428D8